jgi:hypothetical protein
MTCHIDVNNDDNSELLYTSSRANISITRSSNKRSNLYIPDALRAMQQHTLRQTRCPNSVEDLRDPTTTMKTHASRKKKHN